MGNASNGTTAMHCIVSSPHYISYAFGFMIDTQYKFVQPVDSKISGKHILMDVRGYVRAVRENKRSFEKKLFERDRWRERERKREYSGYL